MQDLNIADQIQPEEAESTIEHLVIEAKLREELGKGPSFRTKKEGLIPAVVYSKNIANSHICISPKALQARYMKRHLFPTVVTLQIDDGQSIEAAILSIDVDGVSGKIIHIDFYRADENGMVKAKFGIFHSNIAGSELDRRGMPFLIHKRSVVVHTKIEDIKGPFVLDCKKFGLNPLRKISDLEVRGQGKIIGMKTDQLIAKFMGSKKAREAQSTAVASK